MENGKPRARRGRPEFYSAEYDFSCRITHSRPLQAPRYFYDTGAFRRFRREGVSGDETKGKPKMKKLLLSIAVAAAAPFAWAQVSETTTSTTTTTEGGGTITEYTPGSAIVLKETSGPRRYRFGKTVTYVTKSGKTLDEDTVRTKIKVGVPVHVHYVGTGDDMMVDRVVLDED
jgi:hypothetical protein